MHTFPWYSDINNSEFSHDHTYHLDHLHIVCTSRSLTHTVWIERQPDGSGQILHSHAGKTHRRHEQLAATAFPPCLLDEHWQDGQSRQLVSDYLDWLAPQLLMLPLPQQRRRELELKAQQRPLAVHRYYRLYPEVVDETLLNKILVAVVMRQAAVTA